jgi:hypothetical protein
MNSLIEILGILDNYHDFRKHFPISNEIFIEFQKYYLTLFQKEGKLLDKYKNKITNKYYNFFYKESEIPDELKMKLPTFCEKNILDDIIEFIKEYNLVKLNYMK